MAERKQCEFQLIRYVPDPVKNEFVNIGVLLRAPRASRARCALPGTGAGSAASIPTRTRRCWKRWRSKSDIGCESQPADHPKPIMALLEDSLSNGVQITETKAYLAETFLAGLEDLMRLYVDTPRRERSQRRGGRAALHRSHAHAL